MLAGVQTFLLVPGRHRIHTNVALRPQDKRRIFCSLVPLGTQCRSVTTKGLRWDLGNVLPSRHGLRLRLCAAR
jgi:hypothetical protein